MCSQGREERKDDPTFVPRDTRYFLHDDRYEDDTIVDNVDEDTVTSGNTPVDGGRYGNCIITSVAGNSITVY